MRRDLVFEWYSQFSLKPGADWDIYQPNIFQKVPEQEIRSFERKHGIALPCDYVRFLMEVGFGRLTADKFGNQTFDYRNYFMPLDHISSIIDRKSDDWHVYDDFIYEEEVPFIDIGSRVVHVFESREFPTDSVYFPSGRTKIAESFLDYLCVLMRNVEFHSKRSFGV